MFKLILTLGFLAVAFGAVLHDGKIIGGEPVKIEDFPHQVSMQFINVETMDYEHVCGASIINKNTILTAAHCTDGKPASFIKVKVGTDMKSDDSKLYDVEKVIQHEDFSFKDYNMDVAIFKLKEDLKFTSKIQPIELNTAAIPDNTEVIVSGWGKLNQNKPEKPEQLRAVKVNMVNYEKCQKDYKGLLTKSMICANAKGKDACQGDSGGPLILSKPRKLIGIVSWGEGCGQFEHPGIYTDVAYILPWIKKYM